MSKKPITRVQWGSILGIFGFTFVNLVGRMILSENKITEFVSWWTTFPLAVSVQLIVMWAFGAFRKSKN